TPRPLVVVVVRRRTARRLAAGRGRRARVVAPPDRVPPRPVPDFVRAMAHTVTVTRPRTRLLRPVSASLPGNIDTKPRNDHDQSDQDPYRRGVPLRKPHALDVVVDEPAGQRRFPGPPPSPVLRPGQRAVPRQHDDRQPP